MIGIVLACALSGAVAAPTGCELEPSGLVVFEPLKRSEIETSSSPLDAKNVDILEIYRGYDDKLTLSHLHDTRLGQREVKVLSEAKHFAWIERLVNHAAFHFEAESVGSVFLCRVDRRYRIIYKGLNPIGGRLSRILDLNSHDWRPIRKEAIQIGRLKVNVCSELSLGGLSGNFDSLSRSVGGVARFSDSVPSGFKRKADQDYPDHTGDKLSDAEISDDLSRLSRPDVRITALASLGLVLFAAYFGSLLYRRPVRLDLDNKPSKPDK